MSSSSRLVRGLCCALALAAAPAGFSSAAEPRERIVHRKPAEDTSQARVIVKFRTTSPLMRPLAAAPNAPPALPQHALALQARLALPLVDGRALGPRTQALRGRGVTSAELARRLAAEPDVEWAVVDQRRTLLAGVPNDPYFPGGQTTITPAVGQWYLRAPDATVRSAINAVGAWAVTPGTPTITVAVLDTGVRFDHPDLAGKLHPGYDFIADGDTANDGGGRDNDASDPGDWVSAGECSRGDPAQSSSWHGTQVSGLIGAATDNGIGMASVGRNVMVLPVRVLGKCGGYDSDIIAGMKWAAGASVSGAPVNRHPARVVNMSLGSTGSCNASYRDAVAELNAIGVSVVVAAGNEEGLAVGTPANCPGAIAVGGLRHVGTKVGFSDVGPEIAISAPGGNCVNLSGPCLYPLLTTTNSGTTTPLADTYTTSFGPLTVGTSFSAPLVAGTIALMLTLDPTQTPAVLLARLKATARAFPGPETGVAACHPPNGMVQDECYCSTATCGAGMLDAAAAVAAAVPSIVPAPVVLATASASTVTAGASVSFDASPSTAAANRTIASYQWSIVDGAGLAAFSGPTDAPTATLVTSGAGSVTVRLTVTDSAGATGSADKTVTVQAAASDGDGSSSNSGGGGGGGGALSAPWALLLGAAVWALRRRD